ncbi:MAG: hypothetical protein QXK37_00100 [Candidatus Woesearchaeota archaeon]
MSFLEKVMFWKKRENSDFNPGLDFGQQKFESDFGLSQQPQMGFPQFNQMQQDPLRTSIQNPFDQTTFSQQPSYTVREVPRQDFSQPNYAEKNMEIISSKLDALKLAVESINQRLANIERIALQDQERQRRRQFNW